MGIDHLSLLTPDLASVLEVPNQLFLFGVDADHRLVGPLMHRSLSQELLELLVSLRMLLARRLFDVGAQAVALPTEQAANNWLADKMTSLVQLSANVAQATVEPFLLAHGVARGVRSDDLQQDGYEGRIFFSARGRPPPARRWRVGGWSARSAASS